VLCAIRRADLRQTSIAELFPFSLLKPTPRCAGQGIGLLRALFCNPLPRRDFLSERKGTVKEKGNRVLLIEVQAASFPADLVRYRDGG